jgi:hypothetical protein
VSLLRRVTDFCLRTHAVPELAADRFIESYVCWREACGDVRRAYGRWRGCAPSERGLAFATYRAALEREAHAASIHSDWTDRCRVLQLLSSQAVGR